MTDDLDFSKIDKNRHEHFRPKICVSGAAEMSHLPPEAHETAKVLGATIAEKGAILLNGATTGYPFWAALGQKKLEGYRSASHQLPLKESMQKATNCRLITWISLFIPVLAIQGEIFF